MEIIRDTGEITTMKSFRQRGLTNQSQGFKLKLEFQFKVQELQIFLHTVIKFGINA